MDLIGLCIHQDFVDPSADYRRQQVEHTLKCIDIAHELGVPCIGLNSGRWNTIASSDDLMKARGVEPVLPGYTDPARIAGLHRPGEDRRATWTRRGSPGYTDAARIAGLH